MRLLYFAGVREGIGTGSEDVNPPETVATVSDLLDWLRDRGAPYADTLQEGARLHVAVNQDHASPQTPVRSGDEVAIFPPVTGG